MVARNPPLARRIPAAVDRAAAAMVTPQRILPADSCKPPQLGRYLVSASHTVEGARTLGGKQVAKVIHVSTLTFVAP